MSNDDAEARAIQRVANLLTIPLLKHVSDAVAFPLYVINAGDYTVQMANSAAAPRGPLAEGTTCYALAHGKRQPCANGEYLCPLGEVKRTRKPVTVHHTHYDQEGNARLVQVVGLPILDGRGNVTHMLECTWDVPEQVQLEQAAATAEHDPLARDLPVAGAQTPRATRVIAKVVPRVWEHRPQEGQTDLEERRQLIRGALGKLRAILLELRPATLTEKPVGHPLHPWAPAVSDRTRCLHEQVTVLAHCANCSERRLVEAARQAQAIGDLLEDSALDEPVGAMRSAHAGQPTLALAAVQAWAEAAVSPSDLGRDLTERERDVLGLMVEGLCNAAIARQLCVTASTVKFHVGNIFRKLGAANRAQAAALAVRHRLVH